RGGAGLHPEPPAHRGRSRPPAVRGPGGRAHRRVRGRHPARDQHGLRPLSGLGLRPAQAADRSGHRREGHRVPGRRRARAVGVARQPSVGEVGRGNDGGQHGGRGGGSHDAFGSWRFNRRAHFRDGARSKGVVTAMSEFFRALEQASRDREERLAKQRNNRKPPVAAEPPAQREPEAPVVAKASKPRTAAQPVAAPKPAPTPESKAVVAAPTSTPRKESQPTAAPKPTPRPEPEVVAVAPTITPEEPEVDTVEASVATEVEPETEIATDIHRAIYDELAPAFYTPVEAEIDEDI